jgi:hypothetical protein
MAQPIPFTNQQASGYDALGGAGSLSLNVVSDPTGAVRRRPGIATYSVAPETAVDALGIQGIFATDDGRLLAVGGGARRAVYEVESGVKRELSSPLAGTGRPVFAQTEMLVVITGGRETLKYERAGRDVSALGGNPPLSSHVIAHASRLLENDVIIDKTKVRYSGIALGTTTYAGHENWSFATPAGFFTAESRPDPVVALAENTNEVFVFGTSTLQIFGTDPQAVYIPAGASREFGCSAPHSVIKQDQAFAWLDQYRRFILSDGRNVKVISDAIKADLDNIPNVSDCFGYRVIINSIDCLVWTFPSDGRTFVYQIGAGWSQWSGPDRVQLSIQSHFLRQDTNVNVVGTSDGYIGELSFGAQTDLGDRIDARVETGFLNRGTDMKKHCQCVYLALRRGEATGSTGPVAWLSYRDQPGPWESRIPVDLGRSNDTHPVLQFRSLGTYRRRQWRFEFTGPEEIVLLSASEEFEVTE